MTMQAVQFGAGKIGRGFLGQLLFEGGYRTTFIDADTDLVDVLNGRSEYALRLVSETETQTLLVKNLCALEARRDRDKVTQAIVGADLICVAVGANVLPHVAPALAAGLNARASAGRGPIDVLLCENQWHAASLMRGLVAPHIAPESSAYFETQVGLVETVIGRMVPTITEAQRAEDPLLIVAEPYKELPIARAHLRGEVPSLPGLIATDDFEAYEARKLYLHNMSHAALAYVGHLRSHKYVWQCAADSQVAEVCREALGEVVPALAAEYGFSLADLTAFAEDLLSRFANRALGDTVARVAADPLRKLRPEDRLVGAANLCLKHGKEAGALAQVIAAAFAYDASSDASAQALQTQRRLLGDSSVLETVCGIDPGRRLAVRVSEALLSIPRKTI